jgi:hypothetical protein
VPIDGLTIDWQGNEAGWAGVASGKGIALSGVRGATGQEGKRQ